MSAFIVSKVHIDLLVQAALAGATDGESWLQPGENFCWYHGDEHFELDATADTDHGGHRIGPSQLGQKLVDECVRSVHYRYPDDDADIGELPGPTDAYYLGPYVWEPATSTNMLVIRPGMPRAIVAPATVAEIASALSCFEYQSCETPDWGGSEAYSFCQALRDHLLRCVRGFQAAPWCWDERRRDGSGPAGARGSV